ncbi:MAG TPA: type 1 glutamine amidotransferase family protein [Polyangiales bacterium]|nr:type 1 glutamine amidotransferase family protein [Polyangiales bacterium]
MQTRDVHVYLPELMADWEVGHAIGYINQAEYQTQPGRYRVRSVGLTRTPVRTLGGLQITPDGLLSDIEPASSAMLILPGGASWETGDDNRPAVDKARQLLAAGVPVAAICGATGGLARGGVLDERAHTSNAKVYLEQQPNYGGAANYREERCVRDRGLITAGSTAPVEFARGIFEALELYRRPVLDAWYGLFSTGEAKYFYALMQATQSDTTRR